MSKMVVCPQCDGNGGFRQTVVAGYVSHEMAMDACDMAYEGQPVYEDVDIECNLCNGSGEVTTEEAEEYKHPHNFLLDDEMPF